MAGKNDYYVYVYIDPRNLEEFYYGKGCGDRKNAHLSDESDSEKVKRIKAIKREGLLPTIKVIAKDLTQEQAFLIEKTLIWKLGRNLTNKSSGHFADKFRPHDSLHKDLPAFDYRNGVYYVNVGEGDHRCWKDCKTYGFLSAGQHPKWSNQIRTLQEGDIVVPYLKGRGYVGIGKVIERAIRMEHFKINGNPLHRYSLSEPNIYNNCDNENSEYPVKIQWMVAVNSQDAKWQSKANLFTTQLVKASLHEQVQTLRYLEQVFDVNSTNYCNKPPLFTAF